MDLVYGTCCSCPGWVRGSTAATSNSLLVTTFAGWVDGAFGKREQDEIRVGMGYAFRRERTTPLSEIESAKSRDDHFVVPEILGGVMQIVTYIQRSCPLSNARCTYALGYSE